MKFLKSLLVAYLVISVSGCAFLADITEGNPTDTSSKNTTKQPSKSDSSKDSSVDNIDITQSRTSRKSHSKLSQNKSKKLPDVVDLAKGKIIFLRASFVASAVEARIYDVTAGAPKFIAEVKNNTQVHHTLDAGNYTFMLASDSSVDYMNVHVARNLSYYSIVKPSMGAWKPSFSFMPIKSRVEAAKQVSEDEVFFGDDRVDALLSEMTPVIEVVEAPSRIKVPKDIMEKHLRHWEDWKKETPELHASKTLNSLDGI